jgi:hypothetical protein
MKREKAARSGAGVRPRCTICGSIRMLKSVMRPWFDRCGCGRSGARLNGFGSEGLPWRVSALRGLPTIKQWSPLRAADELSLLHAITALGRASSVGGISRPSALAVLLFIASSCFVGP